MKHAWSSSAPHYKCVSLTAIYHVSYFLLQLALSKTVHEIINYATLAHLMGLSNDACHSKTSPLSLWDKENGADLKKLTASIFEISLDLNLTSPPSSSFNNIWWIYSFLTHFNLKSTQISSLFFSLRVVHPHHPSPQPRIYLSFYPKL